MSESANNAPVVLDIRGLTKKFPLEDGRFLTACDNISLRVYKGQTLGIIGESGCGKSTLVRTILQLHPATSGEVIYNGENLLEATGEKRRQNRRRIQMVFQDPYTSLDGRMHVGDILMETLAIQNEVPRAERMDRVLAMLSEVGLLAEHFYRYPHELSGGQRQRVGLARALLLRPELIVCDEPVSALDVSVRAQIINLLLDLQKEEHLTYLFISHDMSVVRYMADRVGVMYLGHLVEEAETDALFERPLHPYTQVLLSAVPTPDPRTKRERMILEGDLPSPLDPPPGCVFHTRCPYATEACRTESPAPRELAPGHRVECHRAGEI